MNFYQTDLVGVVIFTLQRFSDERGFLLESFNSEHFKNALLDSGYDNAPVFTQDNHTMSKKGVLRGLHMQKSPYQQGKLVRVTRGSAFDVVVDLNPNSRTYKKHIGIELSANNNKMIWIPDHCAHGFLSLEDHTELQYKMTCLYAPYHQVSIQWDSPELDIAWPITVSPILSLKDKSAMRFSDWEKQQ